VILTASPERHRRRGGVTRREAWATGFDCGAGVLDHGRRPTPRPGCVRVARLRRTGAESVVPSCEQSQATVGVMLVSEVVGEEARRAPGELAQVSVPAGST